MTTPDRPEHNIAESDFGKRGGGDAGPVRARGEHKPSRKHTLEEVLKSLQDLIRNDLLDEPRPASGGRVRDRPAADDGAASVPSPAAPPDKFAGNEFGQRDSAGPERPGARGEPQGRGGHRLDLPEVIESLKELVATDLDTGDAPAPAAPRRAHPARAAPPVPPEGLQPELPLFDESSAEAPAGPPPVPMVMEGMTTEEIVLEDVSAARETALEGPVAEPGTDEPPVEPSPEGLSVETDLPAPTHETAPPLGDEPHHDDIPVLEDIALHAPSAQARPPAPPPMAPEQAHAIAVKTVARLNVELRKRGEAPLDVKLVKRLELILREALESAGSK